MVKNPQANTMCVHMHQIVVYVLTTIIHATSCSINHVMQTSPGALTFRKDMFVEVPIVEDLIAIQKPSIKCKYIYIPSNKIFEQ